MTITFKNPMVKKETLAKLKKFSADNIYLFFEIDNCAQAQTAGILKIRAFNNRDMIEITEPFKVDGYYNKIKEIKVSRLCMNDYVLEALLSAEYKINAFSQNLKNIKIGDNGYDYWMDMIEIFIKGKRIEHQEIAYYNGEMVSLY